MDSEATPPTNREAMYQAAVSKRAEKTIPSGVLKFVHGHVLFQLQRIAIARAVWIKSSIFAIIVVIYISLLAFLLYVLQCILKLLQGIRVTH